MRRRNKGGGKNEEGEEKGLDERTTGEVEWSDRVKEEKERKERR